MKDQIKRELAAILPEDTSTDIITRIATYIVERTKKVNRVEVIDHTLPVEKGGGRCYVKWPDSPIEVELELQDENRTLKIFIK